MPKYARPKVEMQNACNFVRGDLLSLDFFLNRHSREGGGISIPISRDSGQLDIPPLIKGE
jgi:hypothetical protein